MRLLSLVVDRRPALDDDAELLRLDRRAALRFGEKFFREVKREASVAVRHVAQQFALLARQRQFATLFRLGALQEFFERLVVETVEREHLRARQERGVELE